MQRAAVDALGNLGVGAASLLQSQIFSQGDDAFEARADALEPRQVHLSQLQRRHLARAQQGR